jgi:hypothetical protein|uniref:Uncharacterized protein n=1 Tax=Desulfobacca acetoxidans TaxID=60893 RepID=A0A7C3Z285_9BACT
MLLVNSEGTLYDVPVELLSGAKVNNWVKNKEDILKLFQDLRGVIMKMEDFRDDIKSDVGLGPCCACAGGGQAINYAKYDR